MKMNGDVTLAKLKVITIQNLQNQMDYVRSGSSGIVAVHKLENACFLLAMVSIKHFTCRKVDYNECLIA